MCAGGVWRAVGAVFCFVTDDKGNALFLYLLEIDALQGLMQYIYWLVVSVGLALNVYRLYKVRAAFR